jgi:Tetratricopeptide repeat
LPDISVATDTKARFVGWRSHWPQTGNPTRQLHETVSATSQLLNELHGTPQIKLDSAILSKKMNELRLNLRDLGLWDEAVQVHTTVVELLRAGDLSDVAFSLNNLSTCLWDLGRNEQALKACQEAVAIFRLLVPETGSIAPRFRSLS